VRYRVRVQIANSTAAEPLLQVAQAGNGSFNDHASSMIESTLLSVLTD
jgi:hypothetical protein